jgi:hypothetical protein
MDTRCGHEVAALKQMHSNRELMKSDTSVIYLVVLSGRNHAASDLTGEVD